MKEKKLLIVERSNAPLNYQVEQSLNENNEHSDSIVLTGLFTSFNTKNRNGRIYESADFLPHVEALREQIESKRLLGELDHPHGFEISLGNVSHVVESLEFDPKQNAIVGKIRLLNTNAGKQAQALVRDGIPLNISSRAAGTVDESGHVKLQQLFTYDLVADPGFANAQLKRVNESYGFGDDDNIDIYDISEDANTDLDPHVTQTADYAAAQAASNEDTLKNTPTMDNDNNEFIQYADFQKYSEHLSDIVGELQSAISNIKDELISYKEKGGETPTETFDPATIDNSLIQDLVAKEVEKRFTGAGAAVVGGGEGTAAVASENNAELEQKVAEMEEKYNNLKAYTKYLAETLDKSITHQDYIADEANKMIEHNNYLVENMNNMIGHQDYLAENMNKMIGHQDYLAEKMNQMVAHQDYLAENINDTIAYQNYVAEMVDKHIDYTNMLAEEQNKSIAHNDYLAEKMNQMIDHQDYIVEEINKGIPSENKVNETNKENEEAPVNEQVKEEVKEEADEKKFDAKAYQEALTEKLDTLIATAKKQYDEAKKAEEEALNESKKNVDTKNFSLINYMPARLNERWSKLSDDRKQEILAEAKMFVINNQASAEYFWNTRDFRDKQVELQKIEESKVAQPAPVVENAIPDERLQAMKEQIQRRMRRW